MGLARRKTGKASGEGNIGFDGGKPGKIAIQRKRKATKTKPVGFCYPQGDFGRCLGDLLLQRNQKKTPDR